MNQFNEKEITEKNKFSKEEKKKKKKHMEKSFFDAMQITEGISSNLSEKKKKIIIDSISKMVKNYILNLSMMPSLEISNEKMLAFSIKD